LGETTGRVGKVACWSTKAAISLKRVKIEEKLVWRAYRNSPTPFRTVPTPTPYFLLFPKIGGSQRSKLQSLLSQEKVKLGTSNLAGIFTGSIRTKVHSKFWRKGSVCVSMACPFLNSEYPLLFQEGIKLRTSNFVRIFIVSIETKAH